MKIAEIREIATNELAERIQTEVANYNQMVLNHSISPNCVRENLTNNNGPHGS